MGADLGICEFSTPSTSKRSNQSPLLHKLAWATGAPSAWGGAREPRALDDQLPGPHEDCAGVLEA